MAPTASSTETAELKQQEVSRRVAPMNDTPTTEPETSPNSVPPTTVQRWNHPRRNIVKIAACFWSFIVMGANDAAYGALIHYIESYYNLSYLVVSIIFLSPLVGYISSALLNNRVHEFWGQRGVAALTAGAHILAYTLVAIHPPYPVLVVAFAIAGFGNGIGDAGWNAFIGSMESANQLLGFLHGFYGAGAVLSPLIATSMVATAGLPWYTYYYLMIGFAGLEFLSLVFSFWSSSGVAYKASVSENDSSTGNDEKATLSAVLITRPSARVTWLCSLFLLGYVGIEVALGGWIVVFMIQVRHGSEVASGMTATGFWLGITVGRFVLGFITPKIGEKLAISIYLLLIMGLELLFWLVPQLIVSAVAVGLQGFFLGPLFPATIVIMSRLLPRHLHVGAIGFAAAFGSSGAAILPFAVGAIAQAKGVQVLQPIILALLVVILGLWLGLPRIVKRD
ncbi:hypothetical protein PFICI_06358 [Pestalotiopsis fici W106-1]|uniref:Major facilitator superfamily (MFS) profile domain-containing protein n=1 Tax=Pestalotiopsis fici (strain W106-1 / CGMCC3.15140) TaxID=1229662 RepID=W3X853_PESFW|nr:uncharacterized protein PFICI_06358 [Pestalotiopsis fici W106-1]ETS81356.1 hypothetical protein PFICI_06358 [Pestalotiopsis fici W106-1]